MNWSRPGKTLAEVDGHVRYESERDAMNRGCVPPVSELLTLGGTFAIWKSGRIIRRSSVLGPSTSIA